MVVFGDLFVKSKGQPIKYKGRTVQMWDQFPVPKGQSRLRFRFVSTDSEWTQGVSLKTKGNFIANEEVVKKPLGLWEHTAPREGTIVCDSKDGFIEVVNVWDTGDGVVESWHNGAAMIVEEIKGGRRYYCNDGHLDDDFTDLVFELVIEP